MIGVGLLSGFLVWGLQGFYKSIKVSTVCIYIYIYRHIYDVHNVKV